MDKKNRRLIIISLMLLFSIIMLSLGLKYFPFTKVVKMPSGTEKEFVNPEKVSNFSPNTLYYDFEVAPGKDMPDGFYKGLAHSGQYSVKAFGQNSYSVVVERTAGDVGVGNLKAVAISAWIYAFPTKNDVKGSLVFTASNEVGVNVCWHGLSLTEPEVPREKWFKISAYFDLTKVQFKPEYKLQVYFWNNSSTDILIDDYFIAFGGATDRRGDSARVDMTKPEGFKPKYNYPPFPVSMLEKEPMNRTVDPSDIGPDDYYISGNFFNTGNDGLLVIRKDGKATGYACCPETRVFRKINLSNINALGQVAPMTRILKGKFLSSRADQFIVTGEKGWALGTFEPIEKVCSSTGALQTNMKILWKSDTPAATVYAGDFNGDGRTELLEITGNGAWKVMSFESDGKASGSWKNLATDDNKPEKEWDGGVQEIGISVGQFIRGSAHDVVLTVTRNKSDGKYTWSLRKLNLTGNRWEPVFSEKQDHAGKTIGLDTLKPSDLFLTSSVGGNKTSIYRYNRDWRYDLKEIAFNDSTFTILSAVDFQGYDKDQNPKYYESLKLVPGCFLNSSSVSFLTIGHVAKSRQYQSILPDFVHLYSLPANK
ncbi:MAG: hypothetical protein Q8M08_01885 [Bacteroidales bacterium]|nr:hypothetical protein [Bacteroidales bacterium]